MNDITNKKDVIQFINFFYQEVRKDEILGPVFSQRVKDDEWPAHLEKMYSFWNTVLFGVKDYHGNPFSHHIGLDINGMHFERWISLFTKVINSNFEGPKASEALLRAGSIRTIFESKLKHISSNAS